MFQNDQKEGFYSVRSFLEIALSQMPACGQQLLCLICSYQLFCIYLFPPIEGKSVKLYNKHNSETSAKFSDFGDVSSMGDVSV